MAASLLVLAQITTFTLAAWALGRLLLHGARWEPDPEGFTFPLALLFGAGGIALLVFGLGVSGLLYPVVFRSLFALLLAAGLFLLFQRGPGPLRTWWTTEIAPLRRSWLAWAGALLAVVALTSAVLTSLAPVEGTPGNDGIHHYLPQCRSWSLTHDLRIIPDNPYTNLPNYVSSILLGYGQIFALEDAKSVNLLFLFAFLLTLRALFRFLGFSPAATALGILVFLATPLTHFHLRLVFIDLASTSFLFLSVACWLRYQASGKIPFLISSALLTGLGCGAKYYGLIHLLLMLALQAGTAFRARPADRRGALRRLAWYLGLAALVGCPWYLRSWILLGTPLYPPSPLVFRIFGGKYWTASLAQNAATYDYFAHTQPWDFLWFPWRLTMEAHRYRLWEGITTLYLIFAPCYLLLPKRRALSLIAAYVFAYISILCYVDFIHRYLNHIFPLLLPPLVYVAGYFWERGKRPLRAFLALLLAVNLLQGLAFSLKASAPSWRVSLGLESRPDYVARTTYFYDAYQYLNQRLPPGAVVYLPSFWAAPFFLERMTMKSGGMYTQAYRYPMADFLLDVHPAREEARQSLTPTLTEGFAFPVPPADLALLRETETWRLYQVIKPHPTPVPPPDESGKID